MKYFGEVKLIAYIGEKFYASHLRWKLTKSSKFAILEALPKVNLFNIKTVTNCNFEQACYKIIFDFA